MNFIPGWKRPIGLRVLVYSVMRTTTSITTLRRVIAVNKPRWTASLNLSVSIRLRMTGEDKMKLHPFGKQNPKVSRVTRMEQQDPIQQVVPLMNYYHSLAMKFFVHEKARMAESLRVRTEITQLLESTQMSPDFRKAITESLDSKKYWDSIRDRLF